MSKLHTEKRIKAVDTTQAENNPSNFEDGDIVYDEDGGGGFKKKLGGVGGGSFSPLPAGDLAGLGDVDLAGISGADIGDQLTYSYTDPSKVITWRTGTTIRIDMVKAGKRGYDGNVVAITFVNDAGVAAGAASYDAAGNGTLQITYSNTVTTATQIKTAIDGVSDFTATITGTASHTANSGDGGLGNTSFQDGFTGWKADSPGTGVAPTNLTYDAGTRTIASSTGVDAALPEATGTDAGLMSSSDKVKLNGIATGAQVNVKANWNEGDSNNDAFIQNKPTLVTNLNSVTNVNAPTPAAGDILEYDAGNSEWINVQPAPNDKIEEGNTKVEVTDGGSDGTIEFHTENSRRWIINSDGHLLPDANNTYDIGSATYKVRDLYVDDSSIWIGDEHKISISGGQMKFRRRKNNVLPPPIQSAGGTLSAALTHAGKSTAADMKLRHWLAYMRTLSGQANATITDIFRPGTASDWDSDTDSRGDWNNLLNKPTIPSGNQIIDWTSSQGSDIHADNYTNTTYSVGDGGLTQNNFTNTLKSKLDGIEDSATADQTASEIRTLVESATNSNVFTDADHTKLNGIEDNATADQTAAEIRALVESANDSNVFTDADHTKLNNIAANATNVTNNNQLTNGAGYVTSDTQLSNEQVQDIVGGMVSGNTESGISVVYQDGDGTLDFTVTSQTDNNFTTTLKNKLDGIAAGAEVNVQADWNQNNSAHDAYIDNKPTILDTNGTPSADQLAVWNTSTRLEGDGNLTWNSGTKELKVGYNTDNYHTLKRTTTQLEVNHNVGIFKYLMFNSSHGHLITLSSAAVAGTNTTSPGVDFLYSQPTAPAPGVTAFTHRYLQMDAQGESGRIYVASAVSAGDTSKYFYFQIRTQLLENSTSDDVYIDWYTGTGTTALNLAATVEIQSGTSWTRSYSQTGNFIQFDPVSTNGASGGMAMSNNEVYWMRVTLGNGSGNLEDLTHIKFRHSASNTTPPEIIQISNFHIQGENEDTIISLNEQGYIELPQEVIIPTGNVMRGSRIYTNEYGCLAAKTADEEGPISIGFHDFSWCGGFTTDHSIIGTGLIYIPINSTADNATAQEYNQKIMMRDGELRKVILRGPANAGTTTVRLYVNGNNIQSDTEAWTNENTTGNTDFRYKLEAIFNGAFFNAGDVIQIGVDPQYPWGGSGETTDEEILFATEFVYTSSS